MASKGETPSIIPTHSPRHADPRGALRGDHSAEQLNGGIQPGQPGGEGTSIFGRLEKAGASAQTPAVNPDTQRDLPTIFENAGHAAKKNTFKP